MFFYYNMIFFSDSDLIATCVVKNQLSVFFVVVFCVVVVVVFQLQPGFNINIIIPK